MFYAYKRAIPSASTVFEQGMNMAALLQLWSVMVRIESCPFNKGRSVIKSRAIVVNGGAACLAVMGMRGTFGHVVPDLVL